MKKILRLRGSEESRDKALGSPHSGIKITYAHRVRLSAAREAAASVDIKVSADDVACLEYTNGFRLWIRVDDLYREHAVQKKEGLLIRTQMYGKLILKSAIKVLTTKHMREVKSEA